MLYARVPIKSSYKSAKRMKLEDNQPLKSMVELLKKNIGQPALLFIKQNRKMVPYLVTLSKVNPNGIHFTVKYKCYSSTGDFSSYISHTISVSSLISKEQVLRFFDGI